MTTILNEQDLVFKTMQERFGQLQSLVRKLFEEGSRLDEVEQDLMPMLLEMGRAALEDFVAASGDGDAGETLTKNDTLLKRSTQKHSRSYRSIFGVVEIQRYVYAKREKQKHEAIPLDQKLGLPAAETSYLLEQWMGALASHMAYDAAATWLRDVFGIGGNETTVKNRVRQLGKYAESFRQEVEDPLPEEEAEVIAVLADGKGVPIRTPWEQVLQRELGRKPHLRHRQNDYERSQHRRLRGDNVKTQQAIVGACFSIDRHIRSTQQVVQGKAYDSTDSPKPQNKRLWAEMSCIHNNQESRGAVRVFEQLASHVAIRDPESIREVVCIMDGAAALWKLQREYIPQATPIIDIFHVMEKLWDVAHCFEPDGSKAAEERMSRYLTMLLDGKVDYVRGLFQRFLNQEDWSKTKREKLERAVNYLRDNRHGMQYHEYLARGYPIGSGVIEGACKHVIGDRFCGSGMSWEQPGAQCLLHLRTIKLNGRWKAFIEHRIQLEQASLYGENATAA